MIKAKPEEWIAVPSQSKMRWFGEWVISSIVIQHLARSGELPTRIKTDGKLRPLKNGGARIEFFAE